MKIVPLLDLCAHTVHPSQYRYPICMSMIDSFNQMYDPMHVHVRVRDSEIYNALLNCAQFDV